MTDLYVPIELTLRLLSHLRQRPRVALINVTTGLVYGTAAWTPIYSAAKLGFHAFIRDLRYQLKETSVQVFEVLPPFVETDMLRDLGIEHPPNAASPDEVARAVLRDKAHHGHRRLHRPPQPKPQALHLDSQSIWTAKANDTWKRSPVLGPH